MITQKGKVALGVPQTDVKDVKSLAYSKYLVGFEDGRHDPFYCPLL
jgi:hypothetical protein